MHSQINQLTVCPYRSLENVKVGISRTDDVSTSFSRGEIQIQVFYQFHAGRPTAWMELVLRVKLLLHIITFSFRSSNEKRLIRPF